MEYPAKHLKSLECLCVKQIDSEVSSQGSIEAKVNCHPAVLHATVAGVGSISANFTRARTAKATITGVGDISAPLSAKQKSNGGNFDGEGDISEGLTADYSIKQTVENEGSIDTPSSLNKIAGDFGDFECIQKLYPISDVDVDLNMGEFVGPRNQSGNLYSFIDEGVFTGTYHKPWSDGILMSDDINSYIHPNTLHTSGTFQYKCQVTNFLVRPDNTRLRIRASSPLTNRESTVAPQYTIYDIHFKDPQGNLIVQYNDIIFKGDTDQDNNSPVLNFTTFSSAPKINKVTDFYDWERDSGVPSLHEGTGYTLSFNVKVEALDDPFDEGFNRGFEEFNIDHVAYASGADYLAFDGSPLSTQNQGLINPTNNIKISAVEICNSGAFPLGEGYGPRPENYLSFYVESPNQGRRLERRIMPSFMPLHDFDTGIWPSASSIWAANNIDASNLDTCGSDQIVSNLQSTSTAFYATLKNVLAPDASGKLTLKFSHGLDQINEITKGAFGFGFDQTTCLESHRPAQRCPDEEGFDPSGAFNTQNRNSLYREQGFFDIESITLKVTAKKANPLAADYVLDVVGYSDDKILNSTKAPSGFLQNPPEVQINNILFSSEGVHPYTSGFHHVSDDFALGGVSLSERDNHFEASGNLGGDHYALTTYPTVTSTKFREYEVPLKIYDDNVRLGKSRDYSVSSLFENLYVDICPIPSGASIANIHLLVRYKPQSAFNLITEGGEYGHIDDDRSEASIFPSSGIHVGDAMLNAGSGYGLISYISGIPHAYTTPSSIKTNYARRWRGMQGIVRGPYDPDMFGFGFENPQVDSPFLLGHYTFDKHVDGFFQSRDLGLGDSEIEVNLADGNLNTDLYKNAGWRFIQNSGLGEGNIFDKYLAGYSGGYKTSDWTSLSSGTTNFKDDPLYGKIADAFDSIVRVSGMGERRYIDIQPADTIIDTSGGFSAFLRFSPDANTSGIDYNLFDSGVLFSKWETESELDFALAYTGGYLCGHSQDKDGNRITVVDTMPYSGYQYPLSVLLTYNDHNESGLKLYTDNELHVGDWTTLRASSIPFRKDRSAAADTAGIQIGFSLGSGVGMNMLVSEFGLSTYSSGVHTLYGSGTNIVQANPDRTYKQVTAQEFLEGHRSQFFQPLESIANDSYKLWDYVNEDTYADWSLGSFKYKPFNHEFSSLGSTVGKRTGRDLVNFHIRHSGEPYINSSDLTMPTGVNSGVAYHTQIENDFLRFHLTDAASNFHAVRSRITKNLPAGYTFSDRALVVETILEHESSGNISWEYCEPTVFLTCDDHKHSPTGKDILGPKLIVSLYTKNQEPTLRTPDEPNWGLINRDIHYLHPSSCMTKIESKFTYDNLIDKSENWSIFPTEPRTEEFYEKYFSQDVNDMFLQYDLVYPSGPQFESSINIHSAHVRAEDAVVKATADSGNMNIFASGGNVLNYNLDLFTHSFMQESGFHLYTSGDTWKLVNNSLDFIMSGAQVLDNNFDLYSFSSLPSSGQLPLFTSGDIWNNGSGSFNLMSKGVTTQTVRMPLTLWNSYTSYIPSGGLLNLNTWAPSGEGWTGVRPKSPFNLFTDGVGIPVLVGGSGSTILNIFGTARPENRFPSADMAMFINTPTDFSVSMPLFIVNDAVVTSVDPSTGEIKGLNLFIANYGGTGSDYLMWYNENYGQAIELDDNVNFKIPVGNEIRGVDLIGYGSCVSDSPSKAIDQPLITDDTVWREETCEDGGIFRAKSTYTNSGALYFDGTSYGYSGNYYGVRKYTGLHPQAPYQATVKITTGHTDPIPVPRTLEDWEYGTCGPDYYYPSGCCTADCDQPLAYSGTKLLGDFPYLSGDASITPPSGRNAGDEYGKAVSVIRDLMAVGAPKMELSAVDTYTGSATGIVDAGAVFLYRRGEDVAGKKAYWQMEDKLMLPSGHRKDFIVRTIPNMIVYENDDYGPFTIDGKQWAIGQEGRRFGSSIDLCSSGDQETAVIGAPYAGWTRPFDDIVTSGIPVSMVVFTDSFKYVKEKVEQVAWAARKWDILYKYFSAPWYANTAKEFQPRIDIKLIIFQLVRHDQDRPDVLHDNSWFQHKYISRMDDKTLIDEAGMQPTYNHILSGVSGAFIDMFPSPVLGPHSGIPPIVGIFREDSSSAGLPAFYNKDTENNVVDEFISWYETYAYQNGVIDPTIPQAENGYVNKVLGASEDWKQSSIDLLNETLATGNLITYDALDYITSGVGQKWAKTGAYEFQIPPSSGGRVYIFEKESGNIDYPARIQWNCVQEIKSYADRKTTNFEGEGQGGGQGGPGGGDWFGYGIEYNDRYGHSISISKNSEVISIGSPFTTVPCEIYERDEASSGHMYNNVRNYLVSTNDVDATTRYDELFAESGLLEAARQTYHEMSHDNKFGLRNKYDVQLYKPSFQYKYRDILASRTGTWDFIPATFAGTSRLGYSTAVNDDGDVVAFGAPTDSMNLFEDSNVWYKGVNAWASYTNAGAVRIFEAKKIFPHNLVVEFTRFGNLDRTMHPDIVSDGFYDQMGLYFEPSEIPFRRTEFEELEIPQEAGLAFIITPELDAASDEIIDNIKNWLALGDRTLVLVGNDPVYEDNGLYKESNDVVNKALKKLGSRMRIHPADTKYEALLGDGNLYQEEDGCVNTTNAIEDRYNVTEAHFPLYAHTRYEDYESNISRGDMFAKGVGDIRIDLSDINLEDFLQLSPCNDDNSEVCNLPLKHDGDLRAEWISSCFSNAGRQKIFYKTSWGFHFANKNKAQTCDNYPISPRPMINRPYEDPVAVLTAAEWTADETVIIPAKTGERCWKEYCYKYITYNESETIRSFAEVQHDEVAFNLEEDANSDPTGVYNDFDLGTFFDPDKKNSRDCILQAKANAKGNPTKTENIVSDDSILALRESYFRRNFDDSLTKTTSKAILMASVLGENARSFGATGDEDFPSNNDDQNVLFFVNMIKKDCELAPAVVQLGGFTGRTSFKDAYAPGDTDLQATNVLRSRLEAYGVTVQENATFEDHEDIPARVEDQDVVAIWVANPIDKPTDTDVKRIRRFLDKEDKKIIITYSASFDDTRQIIAANVDYLCEQLDIQSRPYFIPSIGEYFLQKTEEVVKGNEEEYPYRPDTDPRQVLNPEVPSTVGCPEGYEWFAPHRLEPKDTEVEKVALWPYKWDVGSMFDVKPEDYIPVSGGHNSDFEKIISYNENIKEEVITLTDEYEFDHTASIQFPVVAYDEDEDSDNYFPSGYKLFLNWLSETTNDHYDIDVEIGPAIFDPQETEGNLGQDGYFRLEKTTPRVLSLKTLDFLAVQDYINIKISSDHPDIFPDKEKEAGRGLPPLTTRILSVSGCRLNVESEVLTEEKIRKVPCDPPWVLKCEKWFEPEKTIVIPGEFRPIKHPSQQYCSSENCNDPDAYSRGETLIEDGPVIVAEEFEHFSAGINGNKRSKIVVISDSTLIQGQCPHYRNDALGENQLLIRSLYPTSPKFDEEGGAGSELEKAALARGGRLFQFTQKIRGPERGSPAKYYEVSGIANTVNSQMWGHGGTLAKNLSDFTDSEDLYHPANPGFLREPDPVDPAQQEAEIKYFGTGVAPDWGHYPRFSGDFLGHGIYHIPHGGSKDFLVDASRAGGVPDLMKITGTDYLDFDIYRSGCPGDLFGYSIDLTQDKLIVGTPFNAFDTLTAASGVSGIVQWHEIVNTQPSKSGIQLSENGGAGAAFYYERTGSGSDIVSELLPWEFKEKIKPSSINVGLIIPTIVELDKRGDHNLNADFIQDYARRGDMFGYSVSIDSDMIAVGAPNHDFESLHQHVYASGGFLRKEFNPAFDIPDHNIYDLGSSGVRTDLLSNNSGTLVLNNGAVFNYRHEMTDFANRKKTWIYGEKLYPQGHKDRTAANKFVAALVSGCENDYFGWSVAINRAKRDDSDYTLVAGSPFHDWPGSGLHTDPSPPACTSGLAEAGAAYTFDGMLREQIPSIPAEGGWIDLEVFGDKGPSSPLQTRIYQNTTGDPITYELSGILMSNADGEIYLEASGFDPATKGFVRHRPYIHSVAGGRVIGTEVYNGMTLNTFGRPIRIDNAWPQLVSGLSQVDTEFYDPAFSSAFEDTYRPSGMGLFILAPSSAYVYNSVDMNVYGALGIPSGTMNLVASSSGTAVSGIMNLNIGASLPTGHLMLNVRGYK